MQAQNFQKQANGKQSKFWCKFYPKKKIKGLYYKSLILYSEEYIFYIVLIMKHVKEKFYFKSIKICYAHYISTSLCIPDSPHPYFPIYITILRTFNCFNFEAPDTFNLMKKYHHQ